jgi:hypothetical protein
MGTLAKSRRTAAIVVSALLLPGVLVAAACSSNNSNPQPTPVYQVGNEGGTDASADVTTPPGDSSAGGDSQQGEPDGELQDGELVPDQDAAACTTDAGCWSCVPTNTNQFLNQCTTSQCSPFNNALRLPDYDGGLPPL